MNDVDALIQLCCAVPSDTARRGILADKLCELGEDRCELAIRSKRGERIIRKVHRLADELKYEPCLRLLWAVVVVLPVAKPTKKRRAETIDIASVEFSPMDVFSDLIPPAPKKWPTPVRFPIKPVKFPIDTDGMGKIEPDWTFPPHSPSYVGDPPAGQGPTVTCLETRR